MITASDWDGTYTEHPEIHGQVNFIITGNRWTEYERLMEEWVGEKKPIFFNPITNDPGLMDIVTHKANIINQCKAKRYYEDQSEQKSMLSLLCPDCEIILVSSNLTYL